MNIYITSNGIDTRFKDAINGYDKIINVLKNKKVLIVPNAKRPDQDREVAKVVKLELEKNNIESNIVDIEVEAVNIFIYDAIYFTGGEPKILLDSINNANLFNDILKFIDEEKIIIGQSAGAMIFGKEYIDGTEKELKINSNGFGLINKIVIPHYDSLDEEFKGKILTLVKNKDVLISNNSDDLVLLNKIKKDKV